MLRHLLAFSLAVVATACTVKATMQSEDSFDIVTYQGEKIKLARRYTDFHDYRDDPENLPTEIRSRVAQLVRIAPVSKEFANRREMDDAIFKLMFPGYGLSMFQLHEPLALYSLEVPHAIEDRLLVFRQNGERWLLVDDFVWPQSGGYIQGVGYVNGRLRYKDREDKVVLER
jgi:hypothetical protein